MNGFCGVWNIDGHPVDVAALGAVAYRSPLWEPDHSALRIFGGAGFTCTQRFIAPEDAGRPMPYEDAGSGCVVVADSFLTGRDDLAGTLGLSRGAADCELILAAYLKWGKDCPRRLTGLFSFLIWNPHRQTLFAAVDHYGYYPFYYAFSPHGKLVVANTMAPFRSLCRPLSLNLRQFEGYALGFMQQGETCYHEVVRIPAAHSLLVTPDGSRVRRYWRLKQEKRRLPYKSRQEYYEAFRNIFAGSVRDCLRTEYPVVSQISGGLDSSSVTAMAANLLAAKNKRMHGFTAIPLELEGPKSKTWMYHELPVVRQVVDHYPNIDLHVFRTIPDADPVAEQSDLLPFVERPACNVMNQHWNSAAFRHANDTHSRIMLGGDGGNATISWHGYSPYRYLQSIRRYIKYKLRPDRSLSRLYASILNAGLTRSAMARRAARENWGAFDGHYWLLGCEHATPYYSHARQSSLWHGVNVMDPTMDVRLIEFCMNVPQWVYYRGSWRGQAALDHRLLVREALAGIVPEAVRFNTRRGMQAADWYLQYNASRERWRERVIRLSPAASEIFWRCYDREKLMKLFEENLRVDAPDLPSSHAMGILLPEAIAMAEYLEYLVGGTTLSE